MKRTLFISLAVAATALTLVGAFVLQPPPALASGPVESAAEPIAATGDLLCNLTTSDVADIIDHYDLDPDMQALQAALATPFNCNAYGELCEVLDTQDAHAFACGAWMDLKAHETVLDVNLAAVDRVVQWGAYEECSPDYGFCNNFCGAQSNVLHCSGIEGPNGGCRTIVACEDMLLRIWLKNLGGIFTPLDPI